MSIPWAIESFTQKATRLSTLITTRRRDDVLLRLLQLLPLPSVISLRRPSLTYPDLATILSDRKLSWWTSRSFVSIELLATVWIDRQNTSVFSMFRGCTIAVADIGQGFSCYSERMGLWGPETKSTFAHLCHRCVEYFRRKLPTNTEIPRRNSAGLPLRDKSCAKISASHILGKKHLFPIWLVHPTSWRILR
jgi:hypothetical protein